jgi:hypothetical protein
MNNIKFLTSGKNENKLYTFLGGFAGLIIATLFGFWVAQINDSTAVVPIVALGASSAGVVLGNFFGKRQREKSKETDSWNEVEEVGKVKKSRFNNPYDELEMTPFGMIITVVFSYLSIYLSEVLNLAVIFKKQYPDTKFFDILIEVITNIFNVDWARQYLVGYWIFLTIFIAVFAIGGLFWKRKLKKMKDENRKAGDLF